MALSTYQELERTRNAATGWSTSRVRSHASLKANWGTGDNGFVNTDAVETAPATNDTFFDADGADLVDITLASPTADADTTTTANVWVWDDLQNRAVHLVTLTGALKAATLGAVAVSMTSGAGVPVKGRAFWVTFGTTDSTKAVYFDYVLL